MSLAWTIITGGVLVAAAVWLWDALDRQEDARRELARLRSYHHERGADRGHGRPLRENN